MAERSLFNATMCCGFYFCVHCVYMCVVWSLSIPSCQLYSLYQIFSPPSTSTPVYLQSSFLTPIPLLFRIYPLRSLSLTTSSSVCPVPHASHLCRAGRPIITPACKYWSTAPVCMYYFKMLRPVISVLMIVIAKLCVVIPGLWIPVKRLAAWRHTHTQINKHTQSIHTHTLYEGGWRRAGVLMRVSAALGLVRLSLLSVRHKNESS